MVQCTIFYSKIPSINKLNQAAKFQTYESTTVLQCSPLKYVFENIMENGAFAPICALFTIMLSKLYLNFSYIFSMLSKNRKRYYALKIAYGVKV